MQNKRITATGAGTFTIAPRVRSAWVVLAPAEANWRLRLANERVTESVVREHFAKTNPANGSVLVEEQLTTSPIFARLLKTASKSGGGGSGAPEFFVYEADNQSFLIVIECKASTRNHISPRLKGNLPSSVEDIGRYAVDGILHYMRFLAKKVNVIGIAVSGSADDLRVSTYRQMEKDISAQPLLDRAGNPLAELRPYRDYLELFHHDPAVAAKSLDELLAFSKKLHNFMRDYAKLTEEEKPLVISAILLALKNKQFNAAWHNNDDADLPGELLHALQTTVVKSITDHDRQELMLSAYRFIGTHPELGKMVQLKVRGEPHQRSSPIRYMIERVQTEVVGFIDTYEGVDIMGQFYSEFLRYTGGDGKGLGIVLTPKHLTELFVEIADVTDKDTVIDPCAGTGGFLISAMAAMDRLVGDNETRRSEIRSKQLVGIEQQAKMFALGASNMILRGDGRSNLYRGSCFDLKTQKLASGSSRHHGKPTRGLINPPYSQKGDGQHELDFVRCMLDMLTDDGLGVCVVPMSCAIAPHPSRDKILESHTLLAAMSLPYELFYPVGTITCALLFKAHTPHAVTNRPTWFGLWTDDGFVKTKHRGRRDIDGKWDAIKSQWLDDYKFGREAPGRCVKKIVSAQDEWCAEAYLETDYSAITPDSFDKVIKEYVVFKLLNGAG
ncbi:SAM-dependent DNA methyltransferase [Mycobacteroides abscessus]|uniref:site-specific DNA-methyltransferase (adenine-specific) n=3 Tax=Mycobacteroides abscessus TaxID=36809 RepID=A0ABD7HH78_9MYCO|nr:SAM-dependent methyltransferase [Mycobacteroides abscessus]RIR40394.1 SAM-dependent DNA methyltransferase [Mycobacteroides abscessus]RIS62009.1 SAM-dependent DNA methyltransferase [Mycobacteroides abscessus]RIT29262.1 SAM-dependent DNA methyltransferase [Mycobacteroides abscessus]